MVQLPPCCSQGPAAGPASRALRGSQRWAVWFLTRGRWTPPEVLQSCPRAAVSGPKCRPHRGKEPCLGIPGPWDLLGKGELQPLLRRQGSSAIVSRCFNTKELFASPPSQAHPRAQSSPCRPGPLLPGPCRLSGQGRPGLSLGAPFSPGPRGGELRRGVKELWGTARASASS